MLVLKLTEEDLKYFDDLLSTFPNNIFVRTEHGFDMTSSVQIVIDLSDILEVLVPYIVAAIEMVLLYRIQKKQTAISQRELKVHEKELELEKEKLLLEKAKFERNEFEIRISSNGESEILMKTSDVVLLQEDPEKLPKFMNKLRLAISNWKQ